MEVLVWGLVVVVVAAAAFYFLKDDGKITKEEIEQAVEDATDVVEKVVEEVTAVVEKVTPKPKLPPNKELEKLTKAKLEELGRDHGLELDKRMTKENMIKDLRAKYKKL